MSLINFLSFLGFLNINWDFMRIVITYGTFDLFHVGHVRLLKRLRSLGDRLIVGCSTDEFNSLKGKKSLISYSNRVEILQSCKYVDDVFPENDWAQKRQDIIDHKATIFAMGDDWSGKFNDLSDLCEVVYLSRTENISTTEIKQLANSIKEERLVVVKGMINSLLVEVNKLS